MGMGRNENGLCEWEIVGTQLVLGTRWFGYELVRVRVGIRYELAWVRVGMVRLG